MKSLLYSHLFFVSGEGDERSRDNTLATNNVFRLYMAIYMGGPNNKKRRWQHNDFVTVSGFVREG